MNNHAFTFIVSGVDANCERFEDRFFEAGCGDATLALMHGLLAVCFDREAENFSHAVVSAYADILKTGAVVERFEPDYLVTQSEIATRANLSRATVSLYVAGDRGINFPRPSARITTNSPVWDWVEVSTWLYQTGKLSSADVVNARISRAVNWFVQTSSVDVKISERSFIEKMKTVAREPILALA